MACSTVMECAQNHDAQALARTCAQNKSVPQAELRDIHAQFVHYADAKLLKERAGRNLVGMVSRLYTFFRFWSSGGHKF